MLPGSILMLAAMFISSELVALALNMFALIMIIMIPLWFAPLHKEEQRDLTKESSAIQVFSPASGPESPVAV